MTHPPLGVLLCMLSNCVFLPLLFALISSLTSALSFLFFLPFFLNKDELKIDIKCLFLVKQASCWGPMEGSWKSDTSPGDITCEALPLRPRRVTWIKIKREASLEGVKGALKPGKLNLA